MSIRNKNNYSVYSFRQVYEKINSRAQLEAMRNKLGEHSELVEDNFILLYFPYILARIDWMSMCVVYQI
jgi:hypothetical protein